MSLSLFHVERAWKSTRVFLFFFSFLFIQHQAVPMHFPYHHNYQDHKDTGDR